MVRLRLPIWFKISMFSGIALCPIPSHAEDVCSNHDNILAVINRPANAISPCTVSAQHLLVEGGEQHRYLSEGASADIFPIALIRFGLPYDLEFYAYTPIYVNSHNKNLPSGVTTYALGAKHKIWGNKDIVFAIDGFITPPGGNLDYGAQITGGRLNGVASYTMSDKVNAILMLSVLHQGQPPNLPSTSYTAYAPDIEISYMFTPKMLIYGEIYGQSKISPTLGSGYNFDGGFVFLLKNNVTFDIEVSHSLSGLLGQFNFFVGAGGTVQL